MAQREGGPRKKLYNAHTSRWVFGDGPSAKKYLFDVNAQRVEDHPANPMGAWIVIGPDGRVLPTPLPPEVVRQPNGQPDCVPVRQKRVAFDPSTKTHDGLSAELSFVETSLATLFTNGGIHETDAGARFAKAIQTMDPIGLDWRRVLQTVVDIMTRADQVAHPVWIINVGGGKVLYDPTDPHQHSMIRTALKQIIAHMQLHVRA
jgi:hypothetical protein